MDSVRLDVWLDVACLFKTRSEAQKACNGGKVDVNGQKAKPHRLLRVDDVIGWSGRMLGQPVPSEQAPGNTHGFIGFVGDGAVFVAVE